MQKQLTKRDLIKSMRENALNIAHPKLKNFKKRTTYGLVRNAMIAPRNAQVKNFNETKVIKNGLAMHGI